VNVLVVEDDIGIALLVNRMVRDAGHDVTVVTSYDEALAALDGKTYDIASVDLTLGHDLEAGAKIAAALRQRGVRLIVIVTGHPPVVVEEILARVPVVPDGILHKPFTVPELMRALGLRAAEATA
jgi:DNA-binding response OmpR family regulator